MVIRKTFEKLKNSKNANKKMTSDLQPIVERIKDQMNGNRTLSVPGLITEKEVWRHDLARKSFSYGDISGELSDFQVRCKYKYVEFDMSTTESWTIPESWGDDCAVYVFGEPGSSFTLYEYPLTEKVIAQ